MLVRQKISYVGFRSQTLVSINWVRKILLNFYNFLKICRIVLFSLVRPSDFICTTCWLQIILGIFLCAVLEIVSTVACYHWDGICDMFCFLAVNTCTVLIKSSECKETSDVAITASLLIYKLLVFTKGSFLIRRSWEQRTYLWPF
jgi:hypothetical protein